MDGGRIGGGNVFHGNDCSLKYHIELAKESWRMTPATSRRGFPVSATRNKE